MKKKSAYLALILALALTGALAAPAVAADAAPIMDAGYDDGRWDGFDVGVEAGFADAQAGKAPQFTENYDAGYDQGFAEGYLEGYQTYHGEAETQLQQAEQRIALGGVSEQYNVMVDGEMLAFDAVWPELKNGRLMVPARALFTSLGATVDYQGGVLIAELDGITLKHKLGSMEYRAVSADKDTVHTMDCRSYLKGGTAMVPLHFFGAVFGYQSFWDADYQCGVLLQPQQLIQALDAKTRAVNLLLQDGAARVAADTNYESTTRADLGVTLFDSLHGNRTFRASASAEQLFSRTASDTTVRLDLIDLRKAAQEQNPALLRGEDGTLLALLEKLEFRIIHNKARDRLYIASPLTNHLVGGAYWLQTSLAALTGLRAADIDLPGSVGGTVWSTVQNGGWATPVAYFQEMETASAETAQILGDQNFTKSGNTYTIDTAALLKLAEVTQEDLAWTLGDKGALELRVSIIETGSGTCDFSAYFHLKTDDMRLTVDWAKTGLNGNVSVLLHQKNAFEAKLTVSTACAKTSRTVPSQPPELELIMDLEEAFA